MPSGDKKFDRDAGPGWRCGRLALPDAIAHRVHPFDQLVDIEIIRFLLDCGDVGGCIAVGVDLLRADNRQAGAAGEKCAEEQGVQVHAPVLPGDPPAGNPQCGVRCC